ncbi:hypothetical protein [Anaerobutyricum hallii]
MIFQTRSNFIQNSQQ